LAVSDAIKPQIVPPINHRINSREVRQPTPRRPTLHSGIDNRSVLWAFFHFRSTVSGPDYTISPHEPSLTEPMAFQIG
jgi:hypothetical protein